MPARTPRPWPMLGAAVLAQTSTTLAVLTPAFLIPQLHERYGVSLAAAGALAAASTLGTALTLVAWGAAADRWGERRVLVIGLTATALTTGLAMLAVEAAIGTDVFFAALAAAFFAIGCAGSCASSASGRLIVGWFPAERRGFAMGIRQAAPALGMGAGAMVIPSLVADGTLLPALAIGGTLAAVSAVVCLIVVVDPVRGRRGEGDRPRNPYRGGGALARIHLVSMLLVVPQHVLMVFGLVWFIVGFGWSELVAGLVVGGAQLLGGAGRIWVGVLSDRLLSRLRPLRWIAVLGVGVLLVTALFGWLDWTVPAAIAYVLACCVSVADNGLAYTAVAELAGAAWAGRALGVQNTGQFLTAIAAPPLIGALITAVGYPATFALTAIAPLAAVPLVPPASTERIREERAVTP